MNARAQPAEAGRWLAKADEDVAVAGMAFGRTALPCSP